MNNLQLPDSDIWFVRAEQGNALAGYFLENGVVSMGWGIGPVGPHDSQNEIRGRLRPRYPERGPGTISKWAREIREFNQDMEEGDAVATYEPRGRIYHVGIIRSLLVPPDPRILREWDHDHVHQVEWLYQVPRDTLPRDFLKSNLDRRSTLHRLPPEASAEMRGRCSG